MSRNVVRVDEATVFELLTVASLFLVALFGTLIAYQAYRGYRRNGARSMLYLALGLLLLTLFLFLLNVVVTTLVDRAGRHRATRERESAARSGCHHLFVVRSPLTAPWRVRSPLRHRRKANRTNGISVPRATGAGRSDPPMTESCRQREGVADATRPARGRGGESQDCVGRASRPRDDRIRERTGTTKAWGWPLVPVRS